MRNIIHRIECLLDIGFKDQIDSDVGLKKLKRKVKDEKNRDCLISFKNLSLKLKKKSILDNVTFEVKAGSKVAVMGRTGSGKSSMINCLFGLFPKSFQSGTILYNGINLDDFSSITRRNLLSLVPQNGKI